MDRYNKSQNIKFCVNCGKVVKSVSKICPHCKKPVDMETDEKVIPEQRMDDTSKAVLCPICGSMNTRNRHCYDCGYDFEENDELIEAEPNGNAATKREEKREGGHSILGIALAVAIGIIAAIWIASKIFEVKITGTITPIK